ncbi:unnamed protein product [Paramecium octaurelia]|uniref:Uncharacterized protein n=1 Tax=Paramecium octaurelia TaxID=43137 RepID=A0A8S1U2Z6_PAROT|nr:unnamed protein product [Paramecium octaurelia]
MQARNLQFCVDCYKTGGALGIGFLGFEGGIELSVPLGFPGMAIGGKVGDFVGRAADNLFIRAIDDQCEEWILIKSKQASFNQMVMYQGQCERFNFNWLNKYSYSMFNNQYQQGQNINLASRRCWKLNLININIQVIMILLQQLHLAFQQPHMNILMIMNFCSNLL